MVVENGNVGGDDSRVFAGKKDCVSCAIYVFLHVFVTTTSSTIRQRFELLFREEEE